MYLTTRRFLKVGQVALDELAVLRRAQALSESGSRYVHLAGRRLTLEDLDDLVAASTEVLK